jgi:hypothetical protein
VAGSFLIVASTACRRERAPEPRVTSSPAWDTIADCDHPLPLFEGGKESGLVCPEEAQQRGLTVVNLSDDWSPYLLRDDERDDEAGQVNPYRVTYVALANEQFGRGPEWERARRDIFLELYGITPSFKIVAARLADVDRYDCIARLDSSPIAAIKRPYLDLFVPPHNAAERTAGAAVDARLVCEHLLPATTRPRPRWRLQGALEAFQRKHTVVTRGLVDRETRQVLAQDPRELELLALLRALRARVIDATGVIEDGSARGERATVLGRQLDGEAIYRAAYDALEEGAPDYVSAATEAAALALGWTDVASAIAFFHKRGPTATRELRVALRLPPVPDYHGPQMDLRAEIDRGDVWYERPKLQGRVQRRPTLTLWTHAPDGRDVALVRWPTTIGGWKKEAAGSWGRVVLRYKNSDVGPRMWRDLIAFPAWLPPPKTPPRTIVRRGDGNQWLPDTDLVGPGYASAYGLAMLIHHEQVRRRSGEIRWDDHGIRTHGSVSYDSIQRGESHGCHRLFNQSVAQLASFLLQHHPFVRHGMDARPFLHSFAWAGHRIDLPIPHRGYRYELSPPIPIEVLEGTIRGHSRRVPTQTLYVHK